MTARIVTNARMVARKDKQSNNIAGKAKWKYDKNIKLFYIADTAMRAGVSVNVGEGTAL